MKFNLETDSFKVILAPMLSERSMDLVNRLNTYVFKVHPEASKANIKKAIEDIFEVKVVSINTCNRKGKLRTMRGRKGLRSNWKKAYVKLASDSRIDLI